VLRGLGRGGQRCECPPSAPIPLPSFSFAWRADVGSYCRLCVLLHAPMLRSLTALLYHYSLSILLTTFPHPPIYFSFLCSLSVCCVQLSTQEKLGGGSSGACTGARTGAKRWQSRSSVWQPPRHTPGRPTLTPSTWGPVHTMRAPGDASGPSRPGTCGTPRGCRAVYPDFIDLGPGANHGSLGGMHGDPTEPGLGAHQGGTRGCIGTRLSWDPGHTRGAPGDASGPC